MPPLYKVNTFAKLHDLCFPWAPVQTTGIMLSSPPQMYAHITCWYNLDLYPNTAYIRLLTVLD